MRIIHVGSFRWKVSVETGVKTVKYSYLIIHQANDELLKYASKAHIIRKLEPMRTLRMVPLTPAVCLCDYRFLKAWKELLIIV